MKRFFALLIASVVGVYAPCAYGADDVDASATAVVERTDCADVKTQIDKLSAAADLSKESTETLESLQAEYRRNCMPRVSGRIRSAGKPNVRSVHPAVVADAADDDMSDTPDDVIIADDSTTDEVTDTSVAAVNDATAASDNVDEKTLTPEEAAALIESGLCIDGEKPNKFGCCGDEKFTDMGNLVFACCPPDGGDCFPPISAE